MRFLQTTIGAAVLSAALAVTAVSASAQPVPPGWRGPHYYWHGRHWHHRAPYYHGHRRFYRYY